MDNDATMNDEALEKFRQLSNRLSVAHIRADARAKATHEHFNVFTTVLKATDEVRLHTRFIHCLLDPSGSHDCGTLFLDLFFETLREKSGLDHSDAELPFVIPCKEPRWNVYKEASRSGHGQMDILMERSGYGIAIENKIGASEQELQVSFYAKYLKNRFPENSLVIYLTLDGKRSSTAGQMPYLRISYADHILLWLEKCLLATYRIIPINQVILQYREVVRQLTNQTLDLEDMKSAIEFVIESPDIIRFRAEIALAAETAIQQTWNQIEMGIRSGLSEKYDISIRNGVTGHFGEGQSAALVILPLKASALNSAPFEIWAERDDIGFGVGVVPKDGCYDLSNQMRMSTPVDGGPTERFPLGWKNLISGTDDKDFAEVVRNPNTDGMCDIIKNYVGEVEKAYSEAREKHI